jgi:RNA polymerase sigma-70 factor (ECF subfamily)
MSPLFLNGMTEKDLIKACLKGDRQAQVVIYNCYSAKMLALCMRYARHRLEAEDIFHDAFIKVFTHLEEFSFQGSLEGWIRRIMVNTAIKYNLKKSFSSEQIGVENVPEETTFPDVFSMLSEEELIKMISTLPDGYRIVFNMYAIEGYTHKEIAEMLGIEESTSRSQLVKARRMLQDKVLKMQKVAV